MGTVARGRRAQRCGSRTRERSAAPRGARRWRWRCRRTRTCRRQSPAKGRLQPCREAQRAVPSPAVPAEPATHRWQLGPQAPGRTRRRLRPRTARTTTRSHSRAAAGSALTSCCPWKRRANSSVVFDKDTAPSAGGHYRFGNLQKERAFIGCTTPILIHFSLKRGTTVGSVLVLAKSLSETPEIPVADQWAQNSCMQNLLFSRTLDEAPSLLSVGRSTAVASQRWKRPPWALL